MKIVEFFVCFVFVCVYPFADVSLLSEFILK